MSGSDRTTSARRRHPTLRRHVSPRDQFAAATDAGPRPSAGPRGPIRRRLLLRPRPPPPDAPPAAALVTGAPRRRPRRRAGRVHRRRAPPPASPGLPGATPASPRRLAGLPSSTGSGDELLRLLQCLRRRLGKRADPDLDLG